MSIKKEYKQKLNRTSPRRTLLKKIAVVPLKLIVYAYSLLVLLILKISWLIKRKITIK